MGSLALKARDEGLFSRGYAALSGLIERGVLVTQGVALGFRISAFQAESKLHQFVPHAAKATSKHAQRPSDLGRAERNGGCDETAGKPAR